MHQSWSTNTVRSHLSSHWTLQVSLTSDKGIARVSKSTWKARIVTQNPRAKHLQWKLKRQKAFKMSTRIRCSTTYLLRISSLAIHRYQGSKWCPTRMKPSIRTSSRDIVIKVTRLQALNFLKNKGRVLRRRHSQRLTHLVNMLWTDKTLITQKRCWWRVVRDLTRQLDSDILTCKEEEMWWCRHRKISKTKIQWISNLMSLKRAWRLHALSTSQIFKTRRRSKKGSH